MVVVVVGGAVSSLPTWSFHFCPFLFVILAAGIGTGSLPLPETIADLFLTEVVGPPEVIGPRGPAGPRNVVCLPPGSLGPQAIPSCWAQPLDR